VDRVLQECAAVDAAAAPVAGAEQGLVAPVDGGLGSDEGGVVALVDVAVEVVEGQRKVTAFGSAASSPSEMPSSSVIQA
jgi:hypothetical protein